MIKSKSIQIAFAIVLTEHVAIALVIGIMMRRKHLRNIPIHGKSNHFLRKTGLREKGTHSRILVKLNTFTCVMIEI